MDQRKKIRSGLPGLDEIIDHLRIGDNVVLQVDNIADYESFVLPFIRTSLDEGRKVIYMRFARHSPIIDDNENVKVYHIDAEHGFEAFSTQVHQIIAAEGEEAFYVFDCLSDLLYTWATDLMIGNFFQITCPYLYELKTVAFFAIYKNMNSYETISAIRETTQVLINIYNVRGQTYIHPVKVIDRYSPTMFLPHIKQAQEFIPLTSSSDASKLFADMSLNVFDAPRRHLDYWDRMFLKASDTYEKVKFSRMPSAEEKNLVEKLCRMVLSRDERFLELLTKVFTLEDLLQIKSSLIGSGFIGGKAVGMLLARKILLEDKNFDYKKILEPHDSFYIGSDVFYTYLVKNGLWKLRMEQRKPEKYFSLARVIKSKILSGIFPENVKNHFLRVLEYFGQSPIIVRSSSLLEDGFGNSFAGKYESVFCTNQGTLEHRYLEFENAVKQVFASTMSDDALMYRLKRGIADQDEQMALLVQRVSGSYRKEYFFPDLAGVGYSNNIYVWDEKMSPKAGMLRVVVGLGTRAVNRTAGDYARIIAIDEPLSSPLTDFDDYRQYAQRNIDALMVTKNSMIGIAFNDLLNEIDDPKLHYFAQRDYTAEKMMKEIGQQDRQAWIINFDQFLSDSTFVGVIQKMLKSLEKFYAYPVDIEFTVNFKDMDHYQINLLQCRPLPAKGLKSKVVFPKYIDFQKTFFQSHNTFMGGNIHYGIQRIIYVEPESYSRLSDLEKYRVARCIGKLNSQIEKENMTVLLLGPGRWGTSTPSLGVPVYFSEINNITVLGEIAVKEGGFTPEISYGTHFFQDLIESDIFYVALFPEGRGGVLQTKLLNHFQNLLPELLPLSASLGEIIKVYDVNKGTHKDLEIIADVGKQKAVCFFK
ncbi:MULTISPECIES: PEP/pyruvate-binding domain-containing protein [unclassified Dehalobacter]|uniref:PEP/pyruvate-binding domain-containing protein n=1 Tax=unclassified Dehalobacter TaxID=2635733 RepID=UPI000E6B53F8|nr:MULTISPECIES: PEP/pyruvate-binding domain-containing protein [unclassified Dehalobacter]RJE48866.1 phosphoenolpyruvate synthase [Dehalobacter sp. MCB1]TCX52028.1 phosphoenolpyruvate synthase [Dehalobacter sp. 14DCB1]TCX53102.1 phosphoenolpyruvate synthase [Dehalobacter sp. 12DCB1]